MNRSVLKSIAVSSLLFPVVALGQDAATDTAAAPAAEPAAASGAAPSKVLVPFGKVKATLNLMDSTRKNTPDFTADYWRMGLRVNHGVAQGHIELAHDGTKGVKVRYANMGLDLASGTSFRIGRVGLGGPTPYTTENGNVTMMVAEDQVDGLKLGQKIDLGNENEVSVGLAYANHWGFTGGVPTAFGATSPNNGHLIALWANASFMKIDLGLGYAMQGNQMQSAPATTPAAPGTFADINDLELSLGYSGLAFGTFGLNYGMATRGEVKTGTLEAGEVKNTADTGAKKQTNTLIGFGGWGDLKPFGVENLVETGDTIFWAAAFDMSSVRTDGATGAAKTAEEDADTSTIWVDAGYRSAGGMNLYLTLKQASAKGEIFTDAKGKAVKSNTQVGIQGLWAF